MTTNQAPHTDSSKLIGIAATAIFHVALLLVCLCVWLRQPAAEPPAPVFDDDPEQEITFEEVVDLIAGGSYVTADFLPPEPEPKLAVGANVEAAPPLPPEPTQEEIQEKKRQEISKKVTFNTTTVSEEKGDGGDASTTVAATVDRPTTEGLQGFELGHFERPRGTSQGVIAIRVTLDTDGKVVSAEFYGPRTTYDVIKDPKAKANCITAAKNSKFEWRGEGQAHGVTGFIFYRY
ncbi:MAG: hypothetical protein HDS75_07410 [Bacteroidales bacterium]|nr:hypothetical protein [Bacteroidales bacterium]